MLQQTSTARIADFPTLTDFFVKSYIFYMKILQKVKSLSRYPPKAKNTQPNYNRVTIQLK